MNIQVRSATLTSINLSWDSFLPKGYTSGQYVLYYTDSFSGYVAEWKGQQQVSPFHLYYLSYPIHRLSSHLYITMIIFYCLCLNFTPGWELL